MINLLISVNNCYLDKAEIMLHSLRRYNAEEITVYLINRSLNYHQIRKLGNYLQHLMISLKVINVSETELDELPVFKGRFSVEMYYRVIAQFLLPKSVDRIMWLDADIVICGNISDFYHQDFEDKLLAACPDALCDSEEIVTIKSKLGLPKEHIYFNSGVLLLNIEALREKTQINEIVKTAQSISKNFTYPDQDLLNYLYSSQIKYCDQNRFNCLVISLGKLTQAQIDGIVVLHYAGPQKPWLFYYLHELSKASVPYLREIALQGRWLYLIKLIVLYLLWLVYYKTGICKIFRKVKSKVK